MHNKLSVCIWGVVNVFFSVRVCGVERGNFWCVVLFENAFKRRAEGC